LREFMAPIDDHFADWTFDNLYVELHVAKELPANWKAVRESFMEAYHSPTTHPQLMRTVIDVNTQYDIFSDHVSRFYATLGVPSPLLENPPTDRELVAEMLTGGVGLGGEAEVPEDCQLREGETARSVLSRFQRRRLRETYDVDVSRYSDSEVIDGIQYGLFPNMTLWPGFALPLVYRVRPIGMDVERSLLEVLWLRPIPENGERPEPAEPYHLGVDDSFTTVPGIDQAFADTFDQDTEILASQQKGFKVSTKGVTLANYQEIRLRHMHQTLDKYLNGTVEASEG
jgi:phenylpropionate dioxygenase-like ring-hydroxylating dioxygenase large terminal subunit